MALRILFIIIGFVLVVNLVLVSVGLLTNVNLYEKYGKQILVYVANYQHPTTLKSVVKLTLPIKNVTALVNDKAVNVKDNSFIFDSKIERGQLFLVEIK